MNVVLVGRAIRLCRVLPGATFIKRIFMILGFAERFKQIGFEMEGLTVRGQSATCAPLRFCGGDTVVLVDGRTAKVDIKNWGAMGVLGNFARRFAGRHPVVPLSTGNSRFRVPSNEIAGFHYPVLKL